MSPSGMTSSQAVVLIITSLKQPRPAANFNFRSTVDDEEDEQRCKCPYSAYEDELTDLTQLRTLLLQRQSSPPL